MPSSNLLVPYKTAGLVTDGVQSHLQGLGKENFFTTPVGNSFQVYNLDHLSIAMVSKPLPHDITHMVSQKEFTYAVTVTGITLFNRARPVRSLTWKSQISNVDEGSCGVVALDILGDVLLSLHDNGQLRVWDHKSATTGGSDSSLLISEFQLPPGHTPTCFVHPHTYLNKVAIGTANGSVLIFNFNSGKVIYDCIVNAGIAVTSLAISPVVDVVAVGFANGRVHIHNLRTDTNITTFHHSDVSQNSRSVAGGRITSLSFSSPDTLTAPTLLSASETGSMALWDLTSRSLVHFSANLHEGQITFCRFIPSHALILSSGADNALRLWLVDRLERTIRVLRSRSGHSLPPKKIQFFYGSSGVENRTAADARVMELVSAGNDRALRLTHLALDRQNTEISQGQLGTKSKELGVSVDSLRLPPFTAISCSDRRVGHFPDTLTAHSGLSYAQAWRWGDRRIEKFALALPDPKETVTSVFVTSCGSFGIVGGSNGTVARFTMQDGSRKGVYPKNPKVHNSMFYKGKRTKVGGTADLGPVDRDTGRGTGQNKGLLDDSVDKALFLTMGTAPTKKSMASDVRADASNSHYLRAVKVVDGEDSSSSKKRKSTSHASSTSVLLKEESEISSASYMQSDSPIVWASCDSTNSIVVAVTSTGQVNFFNFQTFALTHTLQLPCGVSCAEQSRPTNLLALAGDDYAIRILDISARWLVRVFKGHSNRVADMSFSCDSKYLVSVAMDRCLRVWDLPASECVDHVRFARAPVSVAFSPTNEYVVTAHAGSLGVSVWANKAHFGRVLGSHARTRPVDLSLPQPRIEHTFDRDDDVSGAKNKYSNKFMKEVNEELSSESGTEVDSDIDDDRSVGDDFEVSLAAETLDHRKILDGLGEPPQHIHDESITLSGRPPAVWAQLTKIDVITQRNKPIEAPKKPENAPFFLTTTGGVNPVFINPSQKQEEPKLPKWALKDTEGNETGEEDKWEGEGADEMDDDEDKSSISSSSTQPVKSSFTKAEGRIMTSVGARVSKSELAHALQSAAKFSLLNSIEMEGDEGDFDRVRTIFSTAAKGKELYSEEYYTAFGAISDLLSPLSPAAVNAQVRSLCLGSEDLIGVETLRTMLEYLIFELSRGIRFDLLQAHIGLVLHVYGEVIVEDYGLKSLAAVLRDRQREGAIKIKTLVDRTLAQIANFLGQ